MTPENTRIVSTFTNEFLDQYTSWYCNRYTDCDYLKIPCSLSKPIWHLSSFINFCSVKSSFIQHATYIYEIPYITLCNLKKNSRIFPRHHVTRKNPTEPIIRESARSCTCVTFEKFPTELFEITAHVYFIIYFTTKYFCCTLILEKSTFPRLKSTNRK